ncbi:MAG: ATP synthase F1 subunit delta [Candidatus Margulisiibacteriota bacterium]
MSITEKYAESLLKVAKDKDRLEDIKKNFAWLVGRLRDNDHLRMVFVSPLFSGDNKKTALDRIVSGVFCGEFISFLHIIADKKREKYIFKIYEHFKKITDVYENKIRVEIKTVFPLDGDLEKKLKKKLEAKTGKKVIVENVIDKRIIGGAVLKMNDYILDRSVLSGLTALEKELVS